MVVEREIYSGPATGLYDPHRFDEFMKRSFGSHVNPEPTTPGAIMYHFPDSGVGVRHAQAGGRVVVSLIGAKPVNVSKFERLIKEREVQGKTDETR